MTSNHEFSQYAAEQGDEWGNLPANGEGWDKPSTIDAELIAAAERVKRYNDDPIVNPDPWCDQYDS